MFKNSKHSRTVSLALGPSPEAEGTQRAVVGPGSGLILQLRVVRPGVKLTNWDSGQSHL